LDQKGQISVELIIVMAAIIAIALVLITQFQATVKEGSSAIETKRSEIFSKIGDI